MGEKQAKETESFFTYRQRKSTNEKGKQEYDQEIEKNKQEEEREVGTEGQKNKARVQQKKQNRLQDEKRIAQREI